MKSRIAATLHQGGQNLLNRFLLEKGSEFNAFPVSFAQERLWFLYQLEPHSPLYNISVALHLHGKLDRRALEQSLNQIIERHEVLRTTFPTMDEHPIQLISPFLFLRMPVIDLRRIPEPDLEAEILRRAEEEARHPFNLESGPLLRFVLLRLNEWEHVLLVTMHHIIADGGSFPILIRELKVLYENVVEGRAVRLPGLPIQYADYALWQRGRLDEFQEDLLYWRQQLGGISLLELPTDKGRPAIKTSNGTRQSFVLSAKLVEELKKLSRREGSTIFMTLLAAFHVLLSRYSGQQDICTGSPVANRPQKKLEDLIGFFANTVVLRTDLSGNPSFQELLKRVRQVVSGAYAHQDVPFEKLVERLRPDRTLSHNPLFQVMFAFNEGLPESFEFAGLTVTILNLDTGTAKFDLTLSLNETARGLIGSFEYNTDLFETATIERIKNHFQILLEAIVASPSRPLSDFSFLTSAERNKILCEWNSTKAEYAQGKCIRELFELQAELSPAAVAVVFGDQELSYAELNARANQLARFLQMRGVGPEVLVAICSNRSIELLIGVLGILKADAAFVPMDPTYPRDRLAFMLQDSHAPVLLTQRRLVSLFADYGGHVICLDADWNKIARESRENPASLHLPETAAYVIYTSGSTGKPKGVVIQNSSVVNLFYSLQEAMAYELSEGTLRVGMNGPLSFDTSIKQIIQLLRGHTLDIIPSEVRLNPHALLTYMSLRKLDVIDCTPTQLELLLAAGLIARTRHTIKRVLVAGEAISRSVWHILANSTGAAFYNLYGPTECTVDAAIGRVQPESTPTIGRPIANTQIFILDRYMQPVPIGHPGELHIGGLSLGRGYLNRPDLTAEKFIPHPFSDEPGARIYKTGDLARWSSQGDIEFLGRRDHQVKIRGFRIEPGEIEGVLRERAGVRDAVVIVRDDQNGNRRLVAYVVPEGKQAPTLSEMRSYSKDKLPEYMVPSAFVVLEALPLTPNGKLDRQALPPPEPVHSERSGRFTASRTPTEEILASIWSQVLGLEQVGIHDNFFDLGGHSLLATQVISRVRESFAIDVPLRTLFEAPTIAQLALAIEITCRAGQNLSGPPIVPHPRQGLLPLSFAQERLWFLHQLEPRSPLYNIPAAVRLIGPLNVAALEQSLNEIIFRHEALRTTFGTVDGQPVQQIAATLAMPLSLIDLRALSEDERQTQRQYLAEAEARRPFDLVRGPLIRATLLGIAEQEHVLLVVLHHIISDGWSLDILVREVATLYQAFATGAPSPLLGLSVQYADFAVWQREWLQGEVLNNQLNYWKQQLQSAPPVLDLPTDHLRPKVQTFNGAKESFILSKTVTEGLKALCRRESVTLFMTLLAAFKVLLYRYTQQTDIVVGTPIANRNRSETENLIGFFVNTLVLRTDLSGNPSFRELLERVREVCLGAYARQDLPFEKLVVELQPERDLSHNPLFQVMFNMLNIPSPRIQLKGLTAELLPLAEPDAKFDLTLYASDQGEDISLTLIYNADLFTASTISSICQHLSTMLEGISSDPKRRLTELPLLRETEQSQSTKLRNLVHPTQHYIKFTRNEIEQSVVARFEEQVNKYSDKIAVKTTKRTMTYGELNRAANRVARMILTRCGEPSERIVLLFEHNTSMIVGMLAALKAGMTYVPLDPLYPKERIVYMLRDSGARAILTDDANFIVAGELKNTLQLVNVDRPGNDEAGENIDLAISPDTLAYILYTSGSTGEPKGVMQNHRNVLHHIRIYTNSLHLRSDDRLTLFSSYSFDAAVMDIFGSLLNGASLHLYDIRREGLGYLSHWLVQQEITIYHSTPTVYRHFMRSLGEERFDNVRLVVMGGEEVFKRDVDLFTKHFSPECIFVNGLGPTESTLALQYFVSQHSEMDRNAVPVGYPVEDTEVVLLNEAAQETELLGEIAIRSDHVALGYWNRPELTSAAFLDDPEGNKKRTYRTGDLGRLLPDGSLQFLRRRDTQVKIRGYRIQMDEIEAKLLEYNAIKDAVVLVREEHSGDKRLVAYIVRKDQGTPTASEIHRFLREKLPHYMLPSAFVFLESLPLTPNGKVDRHALPPPDTERPELAQAYVAPRTVVQGNLAGIWSVVLGIEIVGIHDNFFELGGHSLTATQVISRIRDVFKVELPIRQMFESPTVASLAECIEEAHRLESNLGIAQEHEEIEL